MSSNVFTLQDKGSVIEISIVEYVLELKVPFQTSHSTSQTRTNALLNIKITRDDNKVVEGYGEVGLPPKKRGCYEADYHDVLMFSKGYIKALEETLKMEHNPNDYVSLFPTEGAYFTLCKAELENPRSAFIVQALLALDITCELITDKSSIPAKCGWEICLFDLWGQILNQPVWKLIGDPTSTTEEDDSKKHEVLKGSYMRSFYTASLNDDVTVMVKAAKYGLNYTPLLKIKLDGDVMKGAKVIKALYDECVKTLTLGHFIFAIDANAAWTPDIATQYLMILAPYAVQGVMFMLEQPFPLWKGREDGSVYKVGPTVKDDVPISTDAKEYKQWVNLKSAFEMVGIVVYGDESVSHSHDIQALHPFFHGVNIKLEKAGGYRGAVKAIETAKQLKLKVWIGTMVGSSLTTTAAAQLLPHAYCHMGDVDGALLVDEKSQLFTGGLSWEPNVKGEIVLPANKAGLGIKRKNVE